MLLNKEFLLTLSYCLWFMLGTYIAIVFIEYAVRYPEILLIPLLVGGGYLLAFGLAAAMTKSRWP